jgi:hypothetical protein
MSCCCRKHCRFTDAAVGTCRCYCSRYRGPPLLSKKWMLQGVSGECNSDELPSHPSPSFPPEAVVEAQLAALRCVTTHVITFRCNKVGTAAGARR